jgi:predicted nucleic acid-binding Zn ribbon protein
MCSNPSLCVVCGNPLPIASYKPLTYCSPQCREYAKFKNALQKILISIHPTQEARKLLKGDLFRLANLLGNGTITFEGVKDAI